MILILFVLLFLFIGLGFSIWTAMGISGMIYLLIFGQVSLKILASTLVSGVDIPTLVAIPFFMLAGELMNSSGITRKLADFADYFVGRFRGGLAYVAIVVNVIMAGVSGSAVADASAVSSVLLPTMKEKGYDRPFAASINAAAAVIGPIIPPSIPMIFIGVISGLSIGRLFLGGVVPGLLMGFFLAITVAMATRKKNYPIDKKQLNPKAILSLLKDTLFALLAPLVIILGVVFGIVTLVEVAALANLYILIVSLFVYRSLRFKDIPRIFSKAAVFSTSIMIIFAVVGLYQYIVASEQLGEKLGLLVASMNLNQFTFLLLANIFFLFMGCILDAVPVMLIFFPVLLPAAIKLGVDPTHFGVIVVLNLMIGLLTPPIGALLFLEAKIADLEFDVLLRSVWPYTLALIVVLLLITYIPQLVLFIPNLIL
ncbi:MAG: TRAP transporter large permease [Deltaproteobacteria bacterium]|nr:TRAP transporter large permease [Deltaproteobacteria bacterium]